MRSPTFELWASGGFKRRRRTAARRALVHGDDTAVEPEPSLTVEDNPQASRYELRADGALVGFVDYRLGEGTIALIHTEVDSALRRRGLGSELVAGALADAAKRGLEVIPICPFVVAYLRRHPDGGGS
jgi:predicted GNAT family acetyltransferase